MSDFDLIVHNGTLVKSSGEDVSDIGISEGRIAAVEPSLAGTARDELDASGLHVFPGVIDAHVHFNEPGRTEWEGFATGTRALAAGGATAYVEMPLNAHPPVTDATAFDLKLAAARASSLVDFALWGGIVPGNLGELADLAGRGVAGYKAFMSNSGIEDFPSVDDITLYEGMCRAAELGRIVAVHAENDNITATLARRARAEGRTDIRDYLASRPAIAEVEAIGRAILLAEKAGCPLHVVHVSTGQGVALVAEARRRGVDVTCETCPHYLALSEEDVERLGAVAKCAPPIRTEAEREALWRRLENGDIVFVASDHSPAPPEMKADSDFFKVWGGISGCQTLLTALLTEGWERRGFPLPSIVAVTSERVAARFGFASKGRIAPGYDADLALVDLSESAVLQSADLHYRHRHSPFVGRTLRGRVVRTLLRGEPVYAAGTFASEARGRLIRPAERVL
jgi:allantoinase